MSFSSFTAAARRFILVGLTLALTSVVLVAEASARQAAPPDGDGRAPAGAGGHIAPEGGFLFPGSFGGVVWVLLTVLLLAVASAAVVAHQRGRLRGHA